jgi:hypothetical protein
VFLFEDRAAYEAFYVELFGSRVRHAWQHGTGRVHAVLFCARDETGLPHPPAARARLPGDLLHEYGHALCEARFGDLYLTHVPQWLNEGLADAIAHARLEELFRTSPGTVAKAFETTTPPSYAELGSQLYERDAPARYALGRLMVQELLGERGETAIAPLLDEARRLQDFEAAIEGSCGRTGETLRLAVLRRLGLPTGSPAPEREPAPR